MNPAVIIGMISMVVQGIPEIEAAVAALSAMMAGNTLTLEQQQALGAAMEAAHARVQALGAAPASAG